MSLVFSVVSDSSQNTFLFFLRLLSESINVELLVQCIRSSKSPQTQQQALLVMAAVAHLFPVHFSDVKLNRVVFCLQTPLHSFLWCKFTYTCTEYDTTVLFGNIYHNLLRFSGVHFAPRDVDLHVHGRQSAAAGRQPHVPGHHQHAQHAHPRHRPGNTLTESLSRFLFGCFSKALRDIAASVRKLLVVRTKLQLLCDLLCICVCAGARGATKCHQAAQPHQRHPAGVRRRASSHPQAPSSRALCHADEHGGRT